MVSNEELIERFKSILKFEEDFKNEYEEFLGRLHNHVAMVKIKLIRDWEIEHINLAQELLSVVQDTD
ncbi:MAG: hypothetical protein HZC15_06420 [Candidatus Omnitrophica bacterium]|nr:hypothetical protein [Candidatus Omnitrophota bacterium]